MAMRQGINIDDSGNMKVVAAAGGTNTGTPNAVKIVTHTGSATTTAIANGVVYKLFFIFITTNGGGCTYTIKTDSTGPRVVVAQGYTMTDNVMLDFCGMTHNALYLTTNNQAEFTIVYYSYG